MQARPGISWSEEITRRAKAGATRCGRLRVSWPGPGACSTVASWHAAGITRANGKPFPRPQEHARLWQPVPGGPLFLLTRNFDAVKSYNPANTYALAVCHLGDRIAGEGPFVQEFPDGERLPTLAEVQEIQQRLTALGYDSGGTDGRVGKDTMAAIRKFQLKVGMKPDGYAGLKLLARLREAA